MVGVVMALSSRQALGYSQVRVFTVHLSVLLLMVCAVESTLSKPAVGIPCGGLLVLFDAI